MKIGVLICLLMVAGSSAQDAVVQTDAFTEARRLGEGSQQWFFLFSTSYGSYVIRHDGLSEVGTPGLTRKFLLKPGMTGRVERMYFQEHQGDLLLSFEAGDSGYVRRMNQKTRKMHWLTRIDANVVDQCMVQGNEVHCGNGDNVTKIDLKSGNVVT